jgi:hypothetical protein
VDELKIKSGFMRGVVSKLVEKAIHKKFGYKVDIQINDIDVVVTDGKAHIHLNADGEIDSNEFKKFTKFIDM